MAPESSPAPHPVPFLSFFGNPCVSFPASDALLAVHTSFL